MDISFAIGVVLGIILGFGLALVLKIMKTRTAEELAEEIYSKNEAQLKESFGSLSFDTLSKATGELLKLSREEREIGSKELESKKSLIDKELQNMTSGLEKVSLLMNDLEKDRREKFGELSGRLDEFAKRTSELAGTTSSLREVLVSSRARGQWGERMAKDILDAAGFIENVNYEKQRTIEGALSRPDFTFLLPRKFKLNMDVKFPLDNYVKYVNAASDTDKAKCCNDFLRDVRARFKEITTRDYVNSETLDCVLLFIPSEPIYAFIWENDSSIIDDGLRNKVILCSPISLFGILAVIRQAMDNFKLEEASNEILSLMGGFKKQWGDFIRRFDQMGKHLEETQDDYETLLGTRRRMLERAVDKIDSFRTEKGLPVSEIGELPSGSEESEDKESQK